MRSARIAGELAVFFVRFVAVAMSYRHGFRQVVVGKLTPLCQRLGGAFPKAGQILSTRPDLLSADVCEALARLQDDAGPLPWRVLLPAIENSSGRAAITDVDTRPVASASIAQVHRARRSDGRAIALKIRRPNVQEEMEADCRLVRFFGRFVARLPVAKSFPVNDAIVDVGAVLLRQTDFTLEASNHARLQRMFEGNADVLIPALHGDLCTADMLVMDFIPGLKKLGDASLPHAQACAALVVGLRALYRMIFEDGFIHLDMHPGNVLVAADGRLVLLDAGFMAEISSETRKAFAEFFLAIALRDGHTAARIVRTTAFRLPVDLDVAAFDQEIALLISQTAGLKAAEFQVTGFVHELFAIQRRHRIFGTSQFTLIILALLVYEGTAKQRYPDLDFQQEAVPFVIRGLAK